MWTMFERKEWWKIMFNKMIIMDRDNLVTSSTANAVHTLIASGLPKKQAMIKAGLHPALVNQIDKIAEKYIGYFSEGEEVYEEKIARNSEKMQEYIKACINIHITCIEADAVFAGIVVESIVAGIEESPELALKVAERRWSDEWGAKKQTDVNVNSKSTITTIQVNVPTGETMDADYEEVENE